MSKDDQPRALVYVRVSRRKQTNLNQFQALRRAAEYHGWKITKVIRDHGRTGRKLDRKGLNEVRDILKSHRRQYDVLMVYSISRLGRNTKEMSAFLVEEIKHSGIRLFSHKESIDTDTAAGRLIYNIMASIYEFEVEHTTERIYDGLERARAQGKKLGRPTIPAETEAEVIRLWTEEHIGIRKIAKRLGIGDSTAKRVIDSFKKDLFGIQKNV